jgi:biopolymer transport protein ExbB
VTDESELATAVADVVTRVVAFLEHAVTIWVTGGWAMVAIAIDALVLFAVGIRVHRRLRAKAFDRVRESTWRRWIDAPHERHGPIGALIDFVTRSRTVADAAASFRGLRATEAASFTRDLRVMRICVAAAPLLGLLGTVTGMLATFAALATGSGGDQTMALVSRGISEALITTETGLVVALPGLFFQYLLARKHERYEAFLAHLESVYTQIVYRRQRAAGAAA